MSLFDEECPHCDDAPPSRQIDIHIARAHADLPPCTARIETEHRETYRCAFRAGHDKGQYGKWHASARGNGDVTGRYVWNDGARGATPHRAPEPSYSLDKLKAMGVLSHTIVAASESAPDGPCVCDAAGSPGVSRCLLTCPRREQTATADTGRRCPRCDCADNQPQCEHCKTCEHARPTGACLRPECGGEVHTDPWGVSVQCPRSFEPFAASVGCAVLHRDTRGNVIPCPDRAPVSEGPPCSEVPGCDGQCCNTRDKDEELRHANEAIERITADLDEARAAIERVRMLHRPVEYGSWGTICAECSGWDGRTCDNSPCGYEYCPTLKALAGPEAP